MEVIMALYYFLFVPHSNTFDGSSWIIQAKNFCHSHSCFMNHIPIAYRWSHLSTTSCLVTLRNTFNDPSLIVQGKRLLLFSLLVYEPCSNYMLLIMTLHNFFSCFFSNTFDDYSLSYGIYISIYLFKIIMQFLWLELCIMFCQNMDNYDGPHLPVSCCPQQYLL